MPLGRPRTPPPFELVLRPGDEYVPLTRRGHFALLAEEGLFLGRDRDAQAAVFVGWDTITHVSLGRRSLWIGTQSTVRPVLHGRHTPVDFRDLKRRIEQRIARRPGGALQLSRMRAIDERAGRTRVPWVALGVVVLCVGVHVLQIADAFVSEVGVFVRELVGEGEWWRIVTPHFLHDVTWFYVSPAEVSGVPWVLRFPAHIALNCAGALLLGHLVEQPLGRARTMVVLAAAAVGSIALTAVASPDQVLGASGLVLGLAGAVLALEVGVPERLPASWRIPRRLLFIAFGLELLWGFGSDLIAGWAHLGGFVGGYAAARLVSGGAFRGAAPTGWLRPAAIAVAACVAIAFVAAAPLVLRMGWAFERHAGHVLALDAEGEVGPVTLNNLAWRIATEIDRFPVASGRALELAQRAVAATERSNPDYLDTLAEVQFRTGDADAALLTIDEAIEIAPWDDYFQQQRDRFRGLRAAEDRPESPSLPWFLRGPSEPAPWDDGTGIQI